MKSCRNCKFTYAAVVGFGCLQGCKKTNKQLRDNTMAKNCLKYQKTKSESFKLEIERKVV